MSAPNLPRDVDWQPKLNAFGETVVGVDDVAQCMQAILLTPKGSVPHDPDFGSDVHLYLDWPLQAARPQIIREVIDAIALNEPRATIKRVSVDAAEPADASSLAAIALEVEYALVGTTTVGVLSLVIGASS